MNVVGSRRYRCRCRCARLCRCCSRSSLFLGCSFVSLHCIWSLRRRLCNDNNYIAAQLYTTTTTTTTRLRNSALPIILHWKLVSGNAPMVCVCVLSVYICIYIYMVRASVYLGKRNGADYDAVANENLPSSNLKSSLFIS